MSAAHFPMRDSQFSPMSVANTGFLLERLGQDCHPLQFLRELTQNAIEAIRRSGKAGEIIWDVDWITYDLADEPVLKLSIIDTGDGMSGEQMRTLINQLSSSASAQSMTGNYGVGAKIAAATRNPYGVVYLSWKNGQGSMIQLERHPTGQYGLKRWPLSDGSYSDYMPVDNDAKPDVIHEHGTKVVLLGKCKDDDTMQPPERAAAPSRWFAKYLNTRYFRFPEGVTVKARQGWENPRSDTDNNVLRSLTGQHPYLEQHRIASGVAALCNAKAHWWILKDEKALGSNSGHIESSGHVAALYQDELYEIVTGRAGMSRLQQFGVIIGYRQVVIYIEPCPTEECELTTNTARTQLLLNSQPLPWEQWASEFRENLPDEIEAFVKEKGNDISIADHSKSIRERLKEILDLFKLSRYRPAPSGSLTIDDEQTVRGGASANQGSGTANRQSTHSSPRSASSGRAGNVYAAFERQDGKPGRRVNADPFPYVQWVNVKDGTRAPGFIEDRAATYLAPQNILQINGDFRAFDDMIDLWCRELDEGPVVRPIVEAAVHGWFEQALVETVIGVQALRNSREWTAEEIERALSNEALTAAVMQRYHPYYAIKRELHAKLGKRQKVSV